MKEYLFLPLNVPMPSDLLGLPSPPVQVFGRSAGEALRGAHATSPSSLCRSVLRNGALSASGASGRGGINFYIHFDLKEHCLNHLPPLSKDRCCVLAIPWPD